MKTALIKIVGATLFAFLLIAIAFSFKAEEKPRELDNNWDEGRKIFIVKGQSPSSILDTNTYYSDFDIINAVKNKETLYLIDPSIVIQTGQKLDTIKFFYRYKKQIFTDKNLPKWILGTNENNPDVYYLYCKNSFGISVEMNLGSFIGKEKPIIKEIIYNKREIKSHE